MTRGIHVFRNGKDSRFSGAHLAPARKAGYSGKSAYLRAKRAIDLVLAVLLSCAVAPLLVVAAAAIRLTSKGPAFFCQIRIGESERPFTMFKLRTMLVDCDDLDYRRMNTLELLGPDPREGDETEVDYKLDRNDPRITWVGRILRKYSIDELPQLINVLKGEMSLVGPRPSLPWEVELYSSEQRRRHDCRPGMTGLWQVSGRDSLSMPEMLALDLAYTDSRSTWQDLRILLQTPRAVIASAKRTRAADR